MALSAMTGWQTLGVGANRLDPLVLGPQLLQDGVKAGGIVVSAKEVQLANPLLATKGSKWNLMLDVKPNVIEAILYTRKKHK